MKIVMILALACLSACSWFHPRAKPPPPAPQLIMTGAPAGSAVFVDDVQSGQSAELNKPQVLTVTPGEHIVEVRTDNTVIYREQIYVAGSEKRLIKVLSGTSRE